MSARQKKIKRNYYVSGYDKEKGYVQGETWAYSPEQAASFVAIRNHVNKYKIGTFIDNAQVTVIDTETQLALPI